MILQIAIYITTTEVTAIEVTVICITVFDLRITSDNESCKNVQILTLLFSRGLRNTSFINNAITIRKRRAKVFHIFSCNCNYHKCISDCKYNANFCNYNQISTTNTKRNLCLQQLYTHTIATKDPLKVTILITPLHSSENLTTPLSKIKCEKGRQLTAFLQQSRIKYYFGLQNTL